MAGVSRLQYTTETRLIRVMCSGRIDLKFILKALLNGMDGVFIGGCHLGECNYLTHGNYHALNTALLCKRIMEHIGINPKRLRIEFMSSGEGSHFVDVMNEFGEEINALGPLNGGEKTDKAELDSKLGEIIALVPYIKITQREKLGSRLKETDDYEALFGLDEIEALFKNVISYYIDPEKCSACMACSRKCPVDAIDGGKNRIHVIDQEKCVKCGTCVEACPSRFDAVKKISGQPVPPPLPEEKRAVTRKK